MRFEFDPDKSIVNSGKHGIDFVQAQAIWDDADYIEIPLKTCDEVRFMVIGMIDGKVWSGIITYRGESIRIISVRRSRKEEITIYEG
ncbi:MAG: BrnT family toxin [Desulfuromonadaceae bacterium]|nr:BrnT family toxin [Desulfuromonadaceae bacterium]